MTSSVFATNNLDHKIIKFNDKKLNCDIAGQYPRFYSSRISANERRELNTNIKSFVRSLLERFLTGDEIGKSFMGDLKTGEEGDTFNINFKITRADTKYVSILFKTYFMPTDGPHGVLYYYAFNYDIRGSKVIHLRDLFKSGINYLKQMNYFSNLGLEKQLGKDFSPKNVFREGDQITFDKKSITIHYDVYEVTSYSFGTPEIEAPFDKLTGLKEDIEDIK